MRARLVALLLSLACLCTNADQPAPALKQRVTDLTATLDASQSAALDAQLAALEAEKGAQVAVLIVTSTGADSIEAYATRAFEQWKLGRKGVDDGILLLVAKDDRALRIEVGYGLEGAVTDVQAARIIRERITPAFREGDFFGGIQAGTDALSGLVRGEPLPEPSAREPQPDTINLFSLCLFFAQFFIVPALVKRIPRPWARQHSGRRYFSCIGLVTVATLIYCLTTGTALDLLLFFTLTAGFISLFVFIFILAPLSTWKVSSGSSGSSSSSSYSSSSDSSSSSSSSGGGFSGGGGSSGGGGASGRW
ncbi:TPM domain-containing protein [Pseudomonas solani]|uniref:TPM domain-containing protein n=1 Tax=Pseudomonas solani TaxID=2731552 RepID=UPI003C2E2428